MSFNFVVKFRVNLTIGKSKIKIDTPIEDLIAKLSTYQAIYFYDLKLFQRVARINIKASKLQRISSQNMSQTPDLTDTIEHVS